jgi:hypothetical protein
MTPLCGVCSSPLRKAAVPRGKETLRRPHSWLGGFLARRDAPFVGAGALEGALSRVVAGRAVGGLAGFC